MNELNRIIEALREGSKQKLIIGNFESAVVPAQESILCPVGIQSTKLLLKSIEVTCSKNTEFYVEFFEEAAMTNSRYNSGIRETEAYDVLDLPFINKDGVDIMYVLIHNTSDYEATYHTEIRGIAMK